MYISAPVPVGYADTQNCEVYCPKCVDEEDYNEDYIYPIWEGDEVDYPEYCADCGSLIEGLCAIESNPIVYCEVTYRINHLEVTIERYNGDYGKYIAKRGTAAFAYLCKEAIAHGDSMMLPKSGKLRYTLILRAAYG